MAGPNDLYHHLRLDAAALPYISNASIVENRPHWVTGSHDTLTSIRNWTERRPGFPVYTADAFPLTSSIENWFTWKRWGSSFYLMLSVVDTTATTSKVYKQQIGTDATFVLIHTDSTSAEPFDFVEANNHVYFGNGTDMKKYDGTTVTNWGMTGPSVVLTATNLAAGLVPGAIGHTWVYAFGVSATGYVSDISDPSAEVTTPLRQWTIAGTGSGDPQCDQIHIYRTEDGGATYLELSNSPIANPGAIAWSMVDNDGDENLQQSSPAPEPGVNAPPPALKGFRFAAGRIWGFKDDAIYFTTYEENTSSVPEECWGQPETNSRSFGAEMMGIGVTADFTLAFTARGIYRIGGDSLSTFTYSRLSDSMGCWNRSAIAEFADKVAWLDVSSTIQVTDGYTIAKDDISLPIRPDIESIVHSQASLVCYSAGKYNWLVLGDGGAGKLRVFDLDLKQWNSPWTVDSLQSVGVGQTVAGTVKLFAGKSDGTNSLPLSINHSTYADIETGYTAALVINSQRMNPDNPTSVSNPEYVAIERNAEECSDVSLLTDEDYTTGAYTSIFINEKDPPNRTPGIDLVEKWYWANTPASARVSAQIQWLANTTKFILYTLDIAYRKVN